MRHFILALALLLPLQSKAAPQLKILTFNTWLVRTVLKDLAELIDERVKLLPSYLASTDADVIALQEVWREDLRDQIVNEMKRYGYQHFATSGRPNLGNGLLLLSKMELAQQVDLLEFSDYTQFDEFFVKKGAIKSQVRIPNLGWVDFFVSHLGAVGFDEEKDEYDVDHMKVRVQQTRELKAFVETNRSQPVMFLAADLNSHYNIWNKGGYTDLVSYEYQLMTDSSSGLGLIDSFVSLNRAILPVWTFDPKTNPYAGDGFFSRVPREFIDYVFVNSDPRVLPVKSDLIFNEEIPQSTCALLEIEDCPKRLSDHNGILSTFDIRI